MQPRIHYFPSAFGDIRLEQVAKGETRVIWYSLTPQEAEAMAKLRQASTRVRARGRWATKDQWAEVGDPTTIFKVGELTEHSITLTAPMDPVVGVLNRALNPERTVVHVVRIGQGKIEEVKDSRYEVREEPEKEESEDPYRAEAPEPDETALAVKPEDKPAVVEKSTTVKQPVRGCPPPDFAQIKRRATRVLRAFLTPRQVDDFEKHQQFMVKGADTGHRYLITSRNAPTQLATCGGRMVYDMNEKRAYCVHDWTIPAEEELLGVAMLLQLPGRESFVRALPDELGGDNNTLRPGSGLFGGVG